MFCLFQLCASDNIFPWFWKGNHQTRAYRQECYLISQTSEISAQTSVVSRKDNHHLCCRPLPSMLVWCQMVSYLIVRLEMQYFHIAFHTAVTSPEALDMPEKNAHGTERKFQQSFKNMKTAVTPSKKRATKSTVCAHSLLNHKLHPISFTFHRKPAEKFILSLLKLLRLCLFRSSPCP